MCAAIALPLRLLNSSRHAMTAPVADFVRVAVNVPRAALTSPFGVGVSFAAANAASIRTVVAWLRAPAAPARTRPSPSAPTPTTKASLFTHPPFRPSGSRFDPLRTGYGERARSDCERCRLLAVLLQPLAE